MKHKLLSILLCLAMALSLLPTAALADETTGAGPIKVGNASYESFSAAVNAAMPDESGVITYEISGKVDVTDTGWVQVAKAGLTDLSKVEFIGRTVDAEICITQGEAILADQGQPDQSNDIDVSFENLKLTKLNPQYAGDYGHSTNYFTCWLRNKNAAENTVTYTNCTFPNGVCNNQYGKTVFDSCQFTNSDNYNLWNYGGNTEVKDSNFSGARGIKTYNEGTLKVAPTVKIEHTTFSGLTEKAAIVVSKATDITLTDVTATNCTMGLLQKDIEGSTDGQKVTIKANGTGISGEFNITAKMDAEAAKNEFNISGGTFTSEVEQDYCKDGFEVKVGEGGKYTVEKSDDVAKIGEQGYTSLAKAIEAANRAADGNNVTVTITKSGEYDPFTITRDNVTVEAADGVTATIKVSKNETGNINATNVTLKKLNFVSTDGTTIFSSGDCDNLTLDGCSFTGNKAVGSTALYIHQPNITITDCKFRNFERGYYTCGDNHAAGKMTFTGNIFTNVRVPIDGYWGYKATENTNIQITGNTFDNGGWDASYIQLWDYAQYLKWEGNTDHQGSAINATIQNNTYVGDVVIYATHFDWFYKSNLTTDPDAQGRVKYRVLVELDGADSATVTNKDGSDITAFNESTQSSKRGEKQVIYSICEGDYIFNIKPTGATEAVLSQPVTVSKPESLGDTSEVTVPADAAYVAQIDETKYKTLAEAINAAQSGNTIEVLADSTTDSWHQNSTTLTGVTINGNGHTLTVTGFTPATLLNGLIASCGNNKINNLTIDLSGLTGSHTYHSAIVAQNGDVIDGVKVIGPEGIDIYGVFANGSAAENERITIQNCEFTNCYRGVSLEPTIGTIASPLESLVVEDCSFTDCDYIILYAKDTTFTGNTVDCGELNIMHSATSVTENKFIDGTQVQFFASPEAFEKNSFNATSSLNVVKTYDEDMVVDISENYWGGGAPSVTQVPDSIKESITGSDVYYIRDTMRDEDLNTNVPPHTGGGSGSSSTTYQVSVDKAEGGKITVSPTRAEKGETVTITVKPDGGYELDELTVTDKDGDEIKLTEKADNKFTFKMPDSKVTVEATFVKIDAGSVLDDFTDVNPNAWYAEAVEFVVEEGLMTGTSSTTFAPDTSMSRAMIWTVLAAYNDYNTSGGNPWYAPGQQWAMVNGVSDGTAPNGSITREQLAVMLWRAAGSPETSKSLSGYADASSVSDWAVEALAWAVDNGIITGMGGSSLAPQTTATRAQVAVMLMQFVDYMEG